jgi:hypothetical protein
MPWDFPSAPYESINRRITRIAVPPSHLWEHFAGAWSALSYRYAAMAEYETALTASFGTTAAGSNPEGRYNQEKCLFGFFSNGFSVFESGFYALYSVGALLSASEFPIGTARDQQRISPTSTSVALGRVFPNDPLLLSIAALFADPSYIEWREIRNILTHRAAPGRTFYVGFEDEEHLPDHWKIKDIPLDNLMAKSRRTALSRMLIQFLEATNLFTEAHC